MSVQKWKGILGSTSTHPDGYNNTQPEIVEWSSVPIYIYIINDSSTRQGFCSEIR